MRIAISGLSGCGNTTATKNVGQALGLKAINYTFRTLADNIGLTFAEIEKKALENPLFDYLVELETLKLSKNEKVVVGSRLSAWVLDADLRIWLHASLEERSARIFSRDPHRYQNSYEQALVHTLRRDEENRQRYLECYGLDLNVQNGLDLIINTQQLTSSQVSSLITSAAIWAHDNTLSKTNDHRDRILRILFSQLGSEAEAYLEDPDQTIKNFFEQQKFSI